MTPTVKTRRRRSSNPGTPASGAHSPAVLLTTALLAVLFVAGPLLLGGTPLWARLPLFVVTALLLAVQGWRLCAVPRPATPRQIDAIDWSVLLFLLYAGARWLTSPAEFISRIEFMQVAACAVVFLTCRHGMPVRAHWMFLLYLLAGVGVAEVVAAFYFSQEPGLAWWSADHPDPNDRGQRWSGTYIWANHFACLLVMALSAALALGSFSKLPWPARIVLIYGGFVMMVGILWSGSRGGCLALAMAIVGLVVMGIRNGTQRWWWPVASGGVLFGVVMVLLVLSPVMAVRVAQSSLTMETNPKNEPRYELARHALQIARDHPAFGTGPATFEFVYPAYRVRESDFYVHATHNDYLNCIDDYGLAGFGLALFFIAAVTLKFFRPLDVDHRWQDRVLVAAGFAVWLALLAHSLFDYNLHVPANALIFFALAGLALGRFRRDPEPHWSTVSLVALGRWPGVVLIVLGLLGTVATVRSTLAAIIHQRAYEHSTVVPVAASIAAGEQALRFDPANQDALMFVGNLYRFRAAHDTTPEEKARDGEQALAAYQQAYRGNPLNDVLLVRVGMGLDLVGRYREAEPYFQSALVAEPRNGRFWQALSDHYAAAGMKAEAAQEHHRSERTFFATKEISEADVDLHGLPGSGENVPPKIEPAPVKEVPQKKPAPGPPPPAQPVDVLVLPAANPASTNDAGLPSSILPEDAGQK